MLFRRVRLATLLNRANSTLSSVIMKKRSSRTRKPGVLLDDDSGDMGNFKTQSLSLEEYFTYLFEKRVSMREEALSTILEALTNKIAHPFVDKNCVTLLYLCLDRTRKGSAKEKQLAVPVIALLAMIVDSKDRAHEVYEDSLPVFSEALKSKFETLKTLDSLALVTFFGASNSSETEQAMEVTWNFIHAGSDSSTVSRKHQSGVLTAAISAWCFLFTTVNGWRLSYKCWQGAISYFSGLLEDDDDTVCLAASEALALIFEMNCLEKFSTKAKGFDSSQHENVTSMRTHASGEELKKDIIQQLRSCSMKQESKIFAYQDPRRVCNSIMDVLKYFEEESCPNAYVKIGERQLTLSTWSQKMQVNYIKHFLGEDGFVKHMKENENLHNIFKFAPKTSRHPSSNVLHHNPEREEVTVRFFQPAFTIKDDSLLPFVSADEKQRAKRMTMSPNSFLSKARTQLLNKQRAVCKDSQMWLHG